jgi:hypothetical protein
MSEETVTVKAINDYPALLMSWELKAKKEDIKKAYHEISQALDEAKSPMYVVVDLRRNIQMPLKETVAGAFLGPYNHPKLAAWLVIGGHRMARIVANSLSQMGREQRVEWFDSEIEVYARLKELLAAST